MKTFIENLEEYSIVRGIKKHSREILFILVLGVSTGSVHAQQTKKTSKSVANVIKKTIPVDTLLTKGLDYIQQHLPTEKLDDISYERLHFIGSTNLKQIKDMGGKKVGMMTFKDPFGLQRDLRSVCTRGILHEESFFGINGINEEGNMEVVLNLDNFDAYFQQCPLSDSLKNRLFFSITIQESLESYRSLKGMLEGENVELLQFKKSTNLQGEIMSLLSGGQSFADFRNNTLSLSNKLKIFLKKPSTTIGGEPRYEYVHYIFFRYMILHLQQTGQVESFLKDTGDNNTLRKKYFAIGFYNTFIGHYGK